MTVQAEAAQVAETLRRLAGAERAAYAEFETVIAGLFRHCGLDEADTAMAVEAALYPQLLCLSRVADRRSGTKDRVVVPDSL